MWIAFCEAGQIEFLIPLAFFKSGNWRGVADNQYRRLPFTCMFDKLRLVFIAAFEGIRHTAFVKEIFSLLARIAAHLERIEGERIFFHRYSGFIGLLDTILVGSRILFDRENLFRIFCRGRWHPITILGIAIIIFPFLDIPSKSSNRDKNEQQK